MGAETLFESESERSRHEIAAFLRELAAEFDTDGPVTFRDGEYALSVTPPERAAFEVEVEREDDDGGSELEIELEIEWDEERESSAERIAPPEPDVGIQFASDGDEAPSAGRFEVYKDRAGEWRWRLVHRNGNIIADGGEGYSSKRNAIKGLRSVQHNAPGARVDERD